MEGENLIMDLKRIVYQWTVIYGIRKNFYLKLSSLMLSYMVVKFEATTSLKKHGER